MDWTGGALHLQLFLFDHDSQQILHRQQHDQQNPQQRLHGQLATTIIAMDITFHKEATSGRGWTVGGGPLQ